MALFKRKSPEEREAQRAKDAEERFQSRAVYLAEKTDIDYKDIVREYQDDPEGLAARFNSLSGARELRGWSIAGLVICGTIAVAGVVNTALTGNPQNIPFISTALTILSTSGLIVGGKKIQRVENSLQSQVESGRNATSPTPDASGKGPKYTL